MVRVVRVVLITYLRLRGTRRIQVVSMVIKVFIIYVLIDVSGDFVRFFFIRSSYRDGIN